MNVSITSSQSANTTIQVTDNGHPIALQIHFESDNTDKSNNGAGGRTSDSNNNFNYRNSKRFECNII